MRTCVLMGTVNSFVLSRGVQSKNRSTGIENAVNFSEWIWVNSVRTASMSKSWLLKTEDRRTCCRMLAWRLLHIFSHKLWDGAELTIERGVEKP